MRWIVIGFLAYMVFVFTYGLARELWRHNGVEAIVGACQLTWAIAALVWSL